MERAGAKQVVTGFCVNAVQNPMKRAEHWTEGLMELPASFSGSHWHWHSLCNQSWLKPSRVPPNEEEKRKQETEASCTRKN